VVQIDRRKNEIRDAEAIRAKYGVAPEFIADYLALVGDAADGYPGIAGLGAKTAATLLNRHGHIEQFPAGLLRRETSNARSSSRRWRHWSLMRPSSTMSTSCAGPGQTILLHQWQRRLVMCASRRG